MSRINIPLDVLTSRLNLSDKFAGVRSQSLSSRFANLKPISEFLDFKRISKPENFSEVQSRVNYNLGHFSSNYAVVFVMLSIYSLLTNPVLLFDIVFVVGGMWGIGKLGGRDLDIGVLKATSSQLYTGLLVIAVPLGLFASPIYTLLWLSRVEELDSDDTDTQGVGLNYTEKRFASDPLQFTGIDLTSGPRSRRTYAYDESDSSEESSEESDEVGDDAVQIALRDKEEALVQSALARIRRAQEKGKREVKLHQDELDALEKRRKRMQSAATAKAKKSGSASGGEKRRRSDRQVVTIPLTGEPIVRKSKSRKSEDSQSLAAAQPPGMLVAGPEGPVYAPFGYYPPQSSSSRSSPARPRSATNRELRGTPPPQYGYQQSGRHFSDGTRPTSSSSSSARRPMPDDADWIPTNSRRSSVSSQYNDPFLYQTSAGHPPPIPQQYMQPPSSSGRRNVSGPADVAYSSVRRTPPLSATHSSKSANSDPNLSRFREPEVPDSQESSSEEDESDDLGNGVQVFVEREVERERAPVPARKPVGRKKGKGSRH
ncbi:Prenylated Rab acceptor 1 [Phlyctema vagabunda]|uniref:Prenylated Rab acceptor 1 n=1 Tax=Phlyctema vagabunda TaxID=108571 RepID=A0ABR4P3F9_9HELO